MKDSVVAREVSRLLADLRCPWGVAGGWAVDLFLDRLTREHQDIEVAIFREHQLILQEYLSLRGWSFEYVRDGRFYPWLTGECLVLPAHEIWCRTDNGPLPSLEILLNERVSDAFVFRRDSRIVAPIEQTFLTSKSGIPILAPEIVLLYKCIRATEPKERLDFSNLLHALNRDRRQWLHDSVAAIDPSHEWLTGLRDLDATHAT